MNRAQLLDRLSNLPFDKKEYWLAAGGAMVLYGFKEDTRDIDLGCSTALADLLFQQGFQTTILSDGSRKIVFAEDIEIFENWLQDKVILEKGFPVVSVDGLIRMKEALGREKDIRDIELIQDCIARNSTKHKVVIRYAIEMDALALAKLGREAMGYAESTDALVCEKLKKALQKDYERVFVAECGGAVAGFVHAEQYEVLYYPTMVNILGLAVGEAFRRFGVATKLMAAVEEWARACGINEIRLNSGITRTGAHEFYRKNGFDDEKGQLRFLKTLN